MKYDSYKINPMIRQEINQRIEYENEQEIKQEITDFMLFIINYLRSNNVSDRTMGGIISRNVSIMMENIIEMGFMEDATNEDQLEYGKKMVNVILIIYNNNIDISRLRNDPDRMIMFLEEIFERFDDIDEESDDESVPRNSHRMNGDTFIKNQVLTIDEIRHNIANDTKEMCGSINEGKYVFKKFGPEITQQIRGSCQLDHHYPKIWHTHPHNSKFYPSLEDIIKVIKNLTYMSVIFTNFGYWTLYCKDEHKYIIDKDSLIRHITKINDTFYEITNGGKSGAECKRINTYINQLTSYDARNYPMSINNGRHGDLNYSITWNNY